MRGQSANGGVDERYTEVGVWCGARKSKCEQHYLALNVESTAEQAALAVGERAARLARLDRARGVIHAQQLLLLHRG